MLIYGGSLASSLTVKSHIALRSCAAVVLWTEFITVMPSSLTLTPQISGNDLRGLENQ